MTVHDHEPSTAVGADGTEETPDEAKARFLDALERKRGRQADAHSAGTPGSSRIHEAHGRAGAKRTFRRKSGG